MEQQEALLADGSPSPRPPSPSLPLEIDGGAGGDSSSSGSGVGADAVSAQLINNITMLDYRSLGKTTALMDDPEEACKVDGLGIGAVGGQLPYFVSWNWPMIRCFLFWGVLSALLACLAIVIATVAALPKTCNPVVPWYRGSIFYEIFPASFQDSNGDGIGDFKGLATRVDYLQELGVKAIRLNSIFQAEHYPEGFRNALSLTDVHESLGTLKDFNFLVEVLHDRNLSLVLDMPIYPYISRLDLVRPSNETSETENKGEEAIAAALRHWVDRGVDGFYLKGAEYLLSDPDFAESLTKWKDIIGENRILILGYSALSKATPEVRDVILRETDLLDIFLDVANATEPIDEQIEAVTKGVLWSGPDFPGVHWSVGDVDSERLSSRLSQRGAPSAVLLNMMLPGTPSIFYGDEVALEGMKETEKDFHESEDVHNLTPMVWPEGEGRFTSSGALPWATGVSGLARNVSETNATRLLAAARASSPPIYLDTVQKDGSVAPNSRVRQVGSVIVVERWYPRRKSFVLVSNAGSKQVTVDLSAWFYGGRAAVATDASRKGSEIVFKALTLAPAEVIVIELEK